METSWEKCQEKGIIKKIVPNPKRGERLKQMALLRLEFWDKNILNKFIPMKVEGFYEIIKELILTLMLKTGFNSTNHLCLIEFLREYYPILDAERLNKLRKVRNEINYRGAKVNNEYFLENEEEFKLIIKKLIKIIN